MLKELNLEDYLAKTASADPVPGGGSAAALNAALSAALTEMVANLTIGRPKFEAVDAEMRDIAAKAARLRRKLVQDIDRDSDAYTRVLKAFQMPKASEAEKAARARAVEAAFRQAALVPLGVARDALALMALGASVIAKGNPNASSDGAAGVLAARMAVRAAVCNVRINLGSLKDEAFKSDLSREADRLDAEAESLDKIILAQLRI
jgi:formiminotetrahydrofolate cyclodeaminase